jgi:CCR4-NOT transcriptional regulation complex NOT5 subunit
MSLIMGVNERKTTVNLENYSNVQRQVEDALESIEYVVSNSDDELSEADATIAQSTDDQEQPSSSSRSYACPQPGCRNSFKTEKTFANHRRRSHAPKGQRPHRCHDCSECFRTLGRLQKHIGTTHGDAIVGKCPKCGKSYHFRYNITKHERGCKEAKSGAGKTEESATK